MTVGNQQVSRPSTLERWRTPSAAGLTTPRHTSGEFNIGVHGLRGVASLMVLWAHILGGTAEHIYADVPAYVAFIVAPWNFGNAGVQLFFVISGFVILPSVRRYSPSEFATRRLLRLYPLFFVLTVIFAVMNMLTHDYPKLNNIETIVSALLFVNLFTGTHQLTPNAWSLSYELCFYALACLTVAALRRRSEWQTLLAAGLSLAFAVAFPISIYFMLGVGIRLLYDRDLCLPARISRLLEALVLPLWIYAASRAHFTYVWSDFQNPAMVPAIAATGLFVYLAAHPRSLTAAVLGNRALLYVGTISYSLYLVHPYAYLALRRLFDKLGLFTPDLLVSMAVFGLVTTAVSIAASHVAHVVLERWPYQFFFRQGIYRVKPGSDPAVKAAVEA